MMLGCSLTAPMPDVNLTSPVPVTGGNNLSTARIKIKHIVIIMQENRSFHEYFATYPGADGNSDAEWHPDRVPARSSSRTYS